MHEAFPKALRAARARLQGHRSSGQEYDTGQALDGCRPARRNPPSLVSQPHED